jgi:Xaa-Pro aminopeptidase
MNATAEKVILSSASNPDVSIDAGSDRRADIEAKQSWVANLLRQVGCEWLLVLEPENFAWLTSGGAARGVADGHDLPLLFFNAEQRWVLSGNFDSQRLFDEELDSLGFQLKEWPWHWGRDQLLADLCQKRRVACDRPFGECKVVGDQLRKQRRTLTAYEQACFRALGHIISHALEATCRGMATGETEREIAGQLGHRILHRGAFPVVINVAADDRGRNYRLCGYTSASITNHCLVGLTARKYGLCATASRSVSFGPLSDSLRKEYEAACRVSATYAASTWPDAVPAEILNSGRRIYQHTGFEHEWRQCPQGHVTGRGCVELALTPKTTELLQGEWGVTWRASIGGAASCDTYLVNEKGPELITSPQVWPLRRIRFQGVEFLRPYPLER